MPIDRYREQVSATNQVVGWWWRCRCQGGDSFNLSFDDGGSALSGGDSEMGAGREVAVGGSAAGNAQQQEQES